LKFGAFFIQIQLESKALEANDNFGNPSRGKTGTTPQKFNQSCSSISH